MKYVSLSTLIVSTSFGLFTLPALATQTEELPTSSQQRVVELPTESTLNASPELRSPNIPDVSTTEETPVTTVDVQPITVVETTPNHSSELPNSTQPNSETPSPEPINTESTEPPQIDDSTLIEPIIEKGLTEQLNQQISVVPQNTALVLSFPNDTQVTIQKDGRSVLAVPLAQPLCDHQGQVVISAGAIAQLQISSTGEDIHLSATELVIAGQVAPIKSSSVPLGSMSLSQPPRSPITRSTNRPWNLLGQYTTPPFFSSTSSVLSQALSTTELMFERTYTERTHVVNIPAQSTFVLTLQEDIVLLGR